MALANGTRLGPYEIVAPIGAGGMGEVYRARDTRLGRTVAIKILPPEFASDAKLKIRFEREAKAISALSHPNICALHDVGPDYLVMEYCEGKTLAQRIAQGPLPIEQVIEYGIQIADALEKAHRAGIIHRDLKPSNIVVTKTGLKLLDFGLAKQSVDSSPEQSTVQQVTEEGKLLGTVQYMAPELFAGKEADARSDIFALGLILYEMAAGKPAFSGTSKASLIAAILEHEPPHVEAVAPLDRLIRECLTKDPDERIQSAHDVKLQLQTITEPTASGVTVPVRSWRIGILWSAATAAVLIAAFLGIEVWRAHRVPRAPHAIKRYSIQLPANVPMMGALSGIVEDFDLSPDGTAVVYRSPREELLFLRRLDRDEVMRIEGTRGGRQPLFSPDGKWIAFFTADELQKVPLGGGAPVPMCSLKDLAVRGAAWSADGMIAFGAAGHGLQIVSAAGGTPRPLTRVGTNERHYWPEFLPDRKHLLFTLLTLSGDPMEAKIVLLSLETGQWRVILEGASRPRYVEPGTLLYMREGSLFSIPFDMRRLAISGSPVPIAADVYSRPSGGSAWYRVASDGTLVYLVRDRGSEEVELLWVDRNGTSVPLSAVKRSYSNPRLSPDGRQLLVTVGHDRGADIWLCDIERDSWVRLTSAGANDFGLWSPDGRQVGFGSSRSGMMNFYIMPGDRSLPPRQMTAQDRWTFGTSWSADGKTIALYEQPKNTVSDVTALTLADGTIRPIAATPFIERFGTFSPDGRWIAYQSNDSGRLEIYVQPFPGPGPRYAISIDGGTQPRWPAPGREIFYLDGGKMMAVDVRTGDHFKVGKPHMLFEADFGRTDPDDWTYDVSPGGQRFVILKNAAGTSNTQLNVIVGAFGEGN